MTEQQREEELLSELLDLPEYPEQRRTSDTITRPVLTRSQERALLRAANQAGIPTLAPTEVEQAPDDLAHSFVSDLAGVARKYPVLTVLAAGSIAFLLARRRR